MPQTVGGTRVRSRDDAGGMDDQTLHLAGGSDPLGAAAELFDGLR